MIDPSGLRQYGTATALTAQLVALVMVGVYAGQAADRWLGTEPLGLLVLALLGFGLGLYVFARTLSQATESDDPPP